MSKDIMFLIYLGVLGDVLMVIGAIFLLASAVILFLEFWKGN